MKIANPRRRKTSDEEGWLHQTERHRDRLVIANVDEQFAGYWTLRNKHNTGQLWERQCLPWSM